ncbi:MAG: sensor histidine kinase [Nitrosopumilus sp.]
MNSIAFSSINNKRTLVTLIITLVGFTILYQTRLFLNDAQFMWISIPTYAILPGFLTVYSSILTVKLFRQHHFQAKAFLLFALGSASWFIAEQIWQAYDHIWEGEPFPSEADIFYVFAYPMMISFLLLSIRPIFKHISKNVWLFAIGLSFSFLIPSILAAYDDISDENTFAVSIALAYPLLSSIELVPAIVGVLFLTKRGANFSWMLILFGLIIYSIADTFFLFAELDGSYYDGHPVDLIYVYSYILLIFSIFSRLNIANITSEKYAMFFSENIQYDAVRKFGIPLTLAIVCLVVLISLIDTVFIQTNQVISTQNITFGVIAMLVVFVVIVLTINKNLSKLVQMRTSELTKQRDNLEHLVEKKTHELLKSERLSAIGELSGRLAHDLRNPLSVMRMSVDLINQTSSDTKISDEKIVDRIDLIKKSIDRISHQVDDVLGYVRNSPLKLTQISLNNLIQTTLEKVNIPQNFEVKVSENDFQINCDPIKLEAVFLNLITNSIQAMTKGGKLEIDISKNKDFVVLDFVDSGEGISNENLPKVFEPLFTTKQKGTGLGLASCKNIIEQHEGKISVKNNPTKFTIIIPRDFSLEISKIKNKEKL